MTRPKTDLPDGFSAIRLASGIVAAYVGKNSVKSAEIPTLLQNVHAAVHGLAEEGSAFVANREPAVPIAKSVTPDFVICLEDGKKLKMLKRYLRTHYNLSPEDYRRKWNLPANYPMVAPNYAKRRSQFAKDIGLGTAATSGRRKRKAATKKAASRGK